MWIEIITGEDCYTVNSDMLMHYNLTGAIITLWFPQSHINLYFNNIYEAEHFNRAFHAILGNKILGKMREESWSLLRIGENHVDRS